MLDDDIAAIREDAQLCKRSLYFGELLVKSDQRTPQTIGGYSFFNELFGRAQADEVAKVVEFLGAAFSRRNQTQALPVIQLLVGDIQKALEFTPRKSLGRTHEEVPSIPPVK